MGAIQECLEPIREIRVIRGEILVPLCKSLAPVARKHNPHETNRATARCGAGISCRDWNCSNAFPMKGPLGEEAFVEASRPRNTSTLPSAKTAWQMSRAVRSRGSEQVKRRPVLAG